MNFCFLVLTLFSLVSCIGSSSKKGNKKFPIPRLATGTSYTCSHTDGTVSCWGTGPIGVAEHSSSLNPLDVGLKEVKQLSGGYYHVCVITSSDSVQCWGLNTQGQLGNNSTTNSSTPVNVIGVSDVKQLALGQYHSCALLNSGNVKCWGKNANGQIGNNRTTNAPMAEDVIGLSGVKKIAAGGSFTCAILSNDSLSCWGTNINGESGAGSTAASDFLVATPFSGMPAVKDIILGFNHGCILTMENTIKCWGDNLFGQLGDGTMTTSATLVDVLNLSGVDKIANGQSATCAHSDKWYCWGYNVSGELGDQTINTADAPVEVKVVSDISNISLGSQHACGILANNEIACWGSNMNKQLGPYAVP